MSIQRHNWSGEVIVIATFINNNILVASEHLAGRERVAQDALGNEWLYNSVCRIMINN
jgi:hypothetical protein